MMHQSSPRFKRMLVTRLLAILCVSCVGASQVLMAVAQEAPADGDKASPTVARYLTLTTRADGEGRKLATASGGVYYPIRRIEDLQKAYDDVVAQLRSAYTITYASNSVSSSPRVRVRTNRDGASVRLSPVVGLNTP